MRNIFIQSSIVIYVWRMAAPYSLWMENERLINTLSLSIEYRVTTWHVLQYPKDLSASMILNLDEFLKEHYIHKACQET